MHKTFETPDPISLYVEIGAGQVRLQTGEVTRTTVEIDGRDADEVEVQQRGKQISIIGPSKKTGFMVGFSSGAHDLRVDVTVPDDSELVTKLGSADLEASGRLSTTKVKSGSGDVNLPELTGDADVQAGSGDVQIDSVGGDLRVKTGSGDVDLGRLHGDASVSTGSGDIEISYTAGSLEAKSGSGDVQVRDAHEDAALSSASGDIAVRTMHRGRLRANNVSGDIEVGVPGGIPVWTDITTLTGDVASTLEGAGQPEEGQEYIELRARTVSGDIHLEQR